MSNFSFSHNVFKNSLLRGKAASGLERILCRVHVKRTPGKYGKLHWPQRYNRKTVEKGKTSIQSIIEFESQYYEIWNKASPTNPYGTKSLHRMSKFHTHPLCKSLETTTFKVSRPENRIFNRVISDISAVSREATLTSDSIERDSQVETEIVRVVFLSTTEITEITRFNPLPHMPILSYSDSAANKDMMS